MLRRIACTRSDYFCLPDLCGTFEGYLFLEESIHEFETGSCALDVSRDIYVGVNSIQQARRSYVTPLEEVFKLARCIGLIFPRLVSRASSESLFGLSDEVPMFRFTLLGIAHITYFSSLSGESPASRNRTCGSSCSILIFTVRSQLPC